MTDPLLYLLAASPPQPVQAQTSAPGAKAAPTDGEGASFEDVLASRIREEEAPEKDAVPVADPAPDAQAANAALAAAAQQLAQPPPATQPSAPSDAEPEALAGMDAAAGAQARLALQAMLEALAPSAPPPMEASGTEAAAPTPAAGEATADRAGAVAAEVQAATRQPEDAVKLPVTQPVKDAAAESAASAAPAAVATDQTVNAKPEALRTDPQPATPDAQHATAEAKPPVVETKPAAARAPQTTDETAQPETAPKTAAVAEGKPAQAQTAAAVGETAAKPAAVRAATEGVKSVEKSAVKDVSSLQAPSAETAKAVLMTYENQDIDPARLAEGRSTEFVQQLARGAEQLHRTGQTSLRMQLYPEDLGRIDLRLTGTSEGVRVSITADLASTGNLLERHMNDLKQALSDSGVTVLGLAVGHGQEQRQNGADGFSRGKDGSVFAPSAISAAEKPEASVVPGRGSSSSYIDYRI